MAGKTLAGEGGKEEARHFPSSELCRTGLGSKPVKGPQDKRERMKGLGPQRHRAGWGHLLELGKVQIPRSGSLFGSVS